MTIEDHFAETGTPATKWPPHAQWARPAGHHLFKSATPSAPSPPPWQDHSASPPESPAVPSPPHQTDIAPSPHPQCQRQLSAAPQPPSTLTSRSPPDAHLRSTAEQSKPTPSPPPHPHPAIPPETS